MSFSLNLIERNAGISHYRIFDLTMFIGDYSTPVWQSPVQSTPLLV